MIRETVLYIQSKMVLNYLQRAFSTAAYDLEQKCEMYISEFHFKYFCLRTCVAPSKDEPYSYRMFRCDNLLRIVQVTFMLTRTKQSKLLLIDSMF